MRLTALRKRIEALSGKLEAAQATIAERDKEVERLGSVVTEREGEIAALQRTVAERGEQVAALYASTSWRVTAPLRAIKTALLHAQRIVLSRRIQRDVKRALLRAQDIVLSRSIQFARTILPKRLKLLLKRVSGWQEPIQPPHIRNATYPLASTTKYQEYWDDNLPLVSVIIPCYNYGRYVEEAVDSVLRQTFQRLEIIVVDDGSTDRETVALLRQLHKPKTRVVHQPNLGLPEARNAGIRHARGKYVCCLDADDTIEPTYLEKAVSLLEANPGVGFVYSWVRLVGDVEDVWYTEPFDLEALIRYNHVSVVAVFRRVDWQRVGGYCSEMRHGYEDWEFWVRLGAHGLRGHLIAELLFNYRRHGRTMTDTTREKHRELVSEIARRNISLFSDEDLRAKLRSGYRDHRVELPFLNLSRSEHFRVEASRDSLLVLLPWLVTGGAETVAYYVLKALTSSIDIHIFTSLPSENEWHDRFNDLTTNIYHLPNFLPEYSWEEFLDNYVTTRTIKNILVAGSKFGYRSLPKIKDRWKDARTINLLHSDSDFGYFGESVRYSRYIDDHIVVSQRIAEKLHRVGGVNESKIHVIYNGVESENTFNPQRYDALRCRELLGLPKTKKIVSWIGRASPEKNPLDFIDAASVLKGMLDVHFILIGDGPLRDQVETKIQKLSLQESLLWLKTISPDTVPEVLASTDVLLLTSKAEGFPLIVLQALAMGVPVVSYDVGEVGTVIKNGINGFIVSPGRREILVERVLQILNDQELFNRFRQNARSEVISRGFTLSRMTEQYKDVIAPQSPGDCEVH